MILGIGSDIVSMTRIEKLMARHEDRFIERCLHKNEIEYYVSLSSEESKISFLSKRFAAKEAAAKALGTGIRDGITLKSIETLKDPLGKPIMYFHDEALNKLQALTPEGMTNHIHVSLSDDGGLALAYVIIEAL